MRNLFAKLGKWTAVAVASFVALIVGTTIGIAAGGGDEGQPAAAAPETVTVAGTASTETDIQTVTETVEVNPTKDQLAKLREQKAALDQREAALRKGEKALQKEIGIVKRSSFSDGTYLVGREVQPGTYRSRGSGGCYWERLSGLGGDFGDIISNDNPSGPTIVAISSSDKAFSSQDCGVWRKIG